MSSRSSVFLTRLANIASIALAGVLAMSAPGTLTQTPPWLNLLLLVVVACAVASFSMPAHPRAPALRDVLLLLLCGLQQVLWLALAPDEFAPVLPWSWALWLSASIVITFRHGRWPGVAFASIGILSYPLSLLFLGQDLAASNTAVLIAPLFLAPIPLVFEQLRQELDELRAATISGERASASAAHASERLRSELHTRQDFAAFVHDNVLGALAAAANSTGPVTGNLRALSRAALSGLRAPTMLDSRPPVPLRDLHEAIAAIADRSGATWTSSLPRTAMPTVPARIAHDLESAFRQAADNSVAHAGARPVRSPARSARFTATAEYLELRYSDDGAGFVLADVPDHRLGLRGSILQRVEQHPGATALVDSAPGSGTTVTLRWTPHPDASARTQAVPFVARASGGASALIAYWLLSTVTSFTTISVQSNPYWTLAANIIVGAATACLVFGMRLTTALTWAIASLPLLTSLLLLPQATPFMPRWQFTLEMATLLCAYLIVRGRVVPGLLGFASMGAVGLGWAWSYGGFHMLQGPRWLATIIIGVALIWWWRLRIESRAVQTLRRDEEAALRQIDDTSIALEGVEQQRDWVDGVARSTLEEIVKASTLSPQQRERARRVEARVRDRMRSPALSSRPLECAVDAARSRGATVSILDDAAATGGLPPAVLEKVIAHLSEAGQGNVVTVRRTLAQLDEVEDACTTREHRVSVFVGSSEAPGTLNYVIWSEDAAQYVARGPQTALPARMSVAPHTV